MSQKINKIIHLTVDILVTALMVAAGICLMIACVSIYRAGDRPFTPESVAAAFSRISAFVYAGVAGVVINLVLEFILPRNPGKLHPKKQYGVILSRLSSKADMVTCQPKLHKKISCCRVFRRILLLLSIVFMVFCSGSFLLYGLNPANFSQTEITGSILSAVLVLALCMVPPFALCMVTTLVNRALVKKEIDLLKQAPVRSDAAAPAAKKSSNVTPFRYAILGFAIGLLLCGFLSGGTGDVLTKAVNICTECVGLG